MTIPRVKVTKTDGNTGVVKPDGTGILAIIAASVLGTANLASAFAKPAAAYTAFGDGPLAEDASVVMNETESPVVLIKPTTSVAAVVGTITTTGGGTSVVTDNSSAPHDDFDVQVLFTSGGTVGTAGIVYQYSLDGGATFSGKIALGTANSITIPSSGVSLALGAGTILQGELVSLSVKGPRMNAADLTAALEALRIYGGAWEAVFVHADADDTMLSALNAWIIAREAEGKFKEGFMNSRARTRATETEAQFLTAMNTAWAASSSTRVSVGFDYCDVFQPIRGIYQARPAQLPVVARTMASKISTMASYVNDGPLLGGNVKIYDSNNSPKWHDEAVYPGGDDLRMVALRTFDAKQGVYCNLPRLISPDGSDYVYVPHLRVINKGCTIASAIMTGELSRGVLKDKKTGRILEVEAAYLEGLVQVELNSQLVDARNCTDAKFTVGRNDDLSSNAGAILTCVLQVDSLAYVIEYDISAGFVKTVG